MENNIKITKKALSVALFGGSFDPVHNGHTAVLKKLCGLFDLVYAIPGFVTPFKQQSKMASADDRLNMLKIALKSNQINAKISTFELDKGGISYTYQTVDYFLDLFSKQNINVKLYFVIGSESIASLKLWKNINHLKSKVTFFIVGRQNFEINQKGQSKDNLLINNSLIKQKIIINELKKSGYKIKVATFKIKDYSSSLFKTEYAFGKGKEMVSLDVYNYITLHKLYQNYIVFFKGFKTFSLNKQRINHTFRAVKAGIMLAKLHKQDVSKTIVALMLHDIAKNADTSNLQKMNISTIGTKHLHSSLIHAKLGANIARDYFKITDQDILNAISFHTTGRANMSPLEKITALADYVEEGRTFKDRIQILNIAKINLDKAMYKMLKSLTIYLKSQGLKPSIDTLNALSFFKALNFKVSLNKLSGKFTTKTKNSKITKKG